MTMLKRICAIILPLAALTACVLIPGKFASTLDIRQDRSFAFTYKGEVIARDFDNPFKGLGKDMEGAGEGDETSKPPADAEKKRENELKMRAIADALSKEQGYRSVEYKGDGKFELDYAINGTLDHGFVFPFNSQAQAVFPFIAIELLKDGKVRMHAPGFGSGDDKSGPMGGGDGSKERDGTFTLTTDAQIVSQNQEEGAEETAKGKTIVWKITPLTRIAPMAVLKLDEGR